MIAKTMYYRFFILSLKVTTLWDKADFKPSPNITLPKNYEEVDVKDEIKAFFDADAINGTDMGVMQ